MATQILHFDLAQGHLRTNSATLNVTVGEHSFPLILHDEHSLARAAADNPALGLAVRHGQHSISHYAEIPKACFLPHHVTLIKVMGEKNGPFHSSLPDLCHLSYHIPDAHLRRHARRHVARLAVRNAGVALPGKLSAMGVEALHLTRELIDTADLLVDANVMKTPWDMACSILFSHPELANSQAYAATIVMNDHIAPPADMDPAQYNRVYELALSLSRQGPATADGGFAQYKQVVDPDGSKMIYEFDWLGKDGEVIFPAGDPVMQYNLSVETENGCGSPVANALSSSRNDHRLQNQNWSVSQSRSVDVSEVTEASLRSRQTPELLKAGSRLWTATNATPNHGLSVYADSISYSPDQQVFSIDFKNTYLRQLGVFIQFFKDSNMQQPIDNPKVNGSWASYLLGKNTFETPSQKMIDVLCAVNTIMGIPMPTDPTKFTLPWPGEAQAARFLFGGLGISRWEEPIVWPGVIMTSVFQYAIPSLMMLGGAVVSSSQWFKNFISDPEVVDILVGIVFPMIVGGTIASAALFNTKKVLFIVADLIVGILAKKGMEQLATYVTLNLASAAAAQAVPVVGWGIRLAALAIGAAQIAVTTGQLFSTPATLEVDIKRQMTLDFTLNPDPKHGEVGNPSTAIWPPIGATCQVTVEYTNGTYFTQTQTLPATSSDTPLLFTFDNIGWGGTLKIKANVYSANGWLAGVYASSLLDAQPDSASKGVMRVEGNIEEMLVPLTQVTQYDYSQQLSFNAKEQRHEWIVGSVPTTTLSGANCSNVGKNVCKLVNITLLDSDYQVGYCYQASGQNIPLENPGSSPNSGQMYVLQNISTLSNETLNQRFKQSETGFTVQPLIAYNTFGTGPNEKSITPLNFIIDSRFGTYHLRQVDLRDGNHTFGLVKANESWGTFTIPHLDAMVVHPSGCVIAVSWKYSKMQILPLGSGPVSDDKAPAAQMVSGQGVLQGLTHGPIALTVTPDGRILLLETGNTRVQAFDTKGNPVPSFTGPTLFTLSTVDFQPSLDAGRFSEGLQAVFRNNGLTFLFTNSDSAFLRDLDAGLLNERIIAVFAEEGIYLCYNQMPDGAIDPVGSTRIKVIEKGQRWEVIDPQKPVTYTLTYAKQGVSVYNDLSDVVVKIIGEGVKWVIEDQTGAKSYLLTVDKDRPEKIIVANYLSYMPLHQPAGITYLDVAVESKGYIYVLSHRNDGMSPSDFILDIYEPDGRYLVSSPDPMLVQDPAKRQYLAAARLVVNQFRTLIALNYGHFQGTNGRTEPVVSQWNPTTPLFDLPIDTLPSFQRHDMAQIGQMFASHGHSLTNKARIETLNESGYFIVTDMATRYPVIATIDKNNEQVISTYGFPV
ncbi:hypothetical protein [Pectobacterium versatile]|uniref:hypothetical protein n=1 Tax=Pectobacterium versatile TaxID=2488639 RepID=UPI001CCF5AD6|nr:hypothetical protein [Pectobacterium versatile]